MDRDIDFDRIDEKIEALLTRSRGNRIHVKIRSLLKLLGLRNHGGSGYDPEDTVAGMVIRYLQQEYDARFFGVRGSIAKHLHPGRIQWSCHAIYEVGKRRSEGMGL